MVDKIQKLISQVSTLIKLKRSPSAMILYFYVAALHNDLTNLYWLARDQLKMKSGRNYSCYNVYLAHLFDPTMTMSALGH